MLKEWGSWQGTVVIRNMEYFISALRMDRPDK